MDENDFYEDDESIEERRAAWDRGIPGVTAGDRELEPGAYERIDEAVRRWEDQPRSMTVVFEAGFGIDGPREFRPPEALTDTTTDRAVITPRLAVHA